MILAMCAQALAGGYFYSDSGIVATGRGGAWIAGADNQFAQYHNPAGLVRVRNATFNIGVGLVQQNTAFERRDASGELLPEASNQAPPFVVPQLGFTAPLIRDELVVAFGMVSPYAPSSDYDPAGAQRYSVIDTAIYQFSWGPSVAWRPTPMLTLGLGLQANVLWLEQSLNVSATGRDDPGSDINVRANVADNFQPNANFGLLFEPHEAVSIGLAVQPGTRFRARGHAVLDPSVGTFGQLVQGRDLNGDLQQADAYQDGRCTIADTEPLCTNDDGIGLAIQLPLVLRAGVAVRPVPELEIEAAVVWQNWRQLEEITLTGIDPQLTALGSDVELPPEFRLPAGLRNTTSLRLGGEYDVSELLALRAGGFYETGAFGTDGINVSLYDPWKVQIGAGASVQPRSRRVRLDAAVATLFFPSLDVTDSAVEQVNVDVLGQNNAPVIVGNGRYRSNGWIASMQASFLFGRIE